MSSGPTEALKRARLDGERENLKYVFQRIRDNIRNRPPGGEFEDEKWILDDMDDEEEDATSSSSSSSSSSSTSSNDDKVVRNCARIEFKAQHSAHTKGMLEALKRLGQGNTAEARLEARRKLEEHLAKWAQEECSLLMFTENQYPLPALAMPDPDYSANSSSIAQERAAILNVLRGRDRQRAEALMLADVSHECVFWLRPVAVLVERNRRWAALHKVRASVNTI